VLDGFQGFREFKVIESDSLHAPGNCISFGSPAVSLVVSV